MNERIIKNWNERIAKTDTVYVVGDVFFGQAHEAKLLIERLNGWKILIRGNHDKSIKIMKECGFDEVYSRLPLTLSNGKNVLLCHRPLPDTLLKDYEFLIHGHVHSGPRVDGKRVNVCVDLWNFSPISEDEMIDLKIQNAKKTEEFSFNLENDMISCNFLVSKKDLEGVIDELQFIQGLFWDNKNKK